MTTGSVDVEAERARLIAEGKPRAAAALKGSARANGTAVKTTVVRRPLHESKDKVRVTCRWCHKAQVMTFAHAQGWQAHPKCQKAHDELMAKRAAARAAAKQDVS